MADRVHPSTKPPANAGNLPAAAAASGGAKPAFPANKAQPYNAARPLYRPQPPQRRRRHSRSCCCRCCLWTTLLILIILLLAGIAGAVLYVLYRPQRPSFSVASLRLARFNLTDTAITSAFNLTLVARNPNRKIVFFYDQISVKVFSGDIDIGDGSFPAFTHRANNFTTLRTVISRSNTPISADANISPLRSSVRSRNLPIKFQLDAKVRAEIGNLKTKKLGMRVTCDEIRVSIPSTNTTSVATISKQKCKFQPRIKILRWTV